MSIITNAGKLAFLRLLKDNLVHIAFGAGTPSTWGTAATQTSNAPSNGRITVPHQFISSVVVTNLTQASTVGTQGTPEAHLDYFVDFNAGEVRMFAPFFAEGDSIKIDYRHGKTAEDADATGLIDKQIQQLCLDKAFVVVDEEDGTVTVDGVTYRRLEPTEEVPEPTSLFLLLSVWLEPGDWPNGVVREVAAFLDPVVDPITEEGQTVFEPDEVLEEGTLVQLTNYAPIRRNIATRARFDLIVSID